MHINYLRFGRIILSLIFIVLSAACTTTITKTIESDPSGADVYIGSSKTNLALVDKTPYTTTLSDINPVWEREFYQVKKTGYVDSEIVLKPRAVGDRFLKFNLSPSGNAENENSLKPVVEIGTVPTKKMLVVNDVKKPEPIKIVKTLADSRRIALIIGNGKYNNAPLANPENDAVAISHVLRKVGFEVETVIDANHKQMIKAIKKFGIKLRQGGTGLFYYAGHGVQLNGQNYLLPVDSIIDSEVDVEFESVPLARILNEMGEARNGANIVILDACRNNPYKRSFRSVSRGLSRAEGPVGTIIAYATSPGSIAADGDGKNGLYTTHLLREIQQPGKPIEFVFKDVAASVKAATNGKQIPWYAAGSFTGEFSFISK